MTVPSYTTLYAATGNVLLQDLDASSGTITIGNNATVTAYSPSNSCCGDVYIVIGAIPYSPSDAGNVNVTRNILNGGMIFLGVNNIDAQGSNTMTANGGLIVLNTAPATASAITLGSHANINATAPGSSLIQSLDLSNSIAVGQIQYLQGTSGSGVTGALTTLNTTYDANGNAILTTGGTVVAPNTALAPTITAVNILSGDTATLSGYTGGHGQHAA